ncbi:MAG: hypothetical protein ACFCU3_04750 [Verrucomicrobiales bacterium]
MINPDALLQGLPGHEMMLKGLQDVAREQKTIEACLVKIISLKLKSAGLLDQKLEVSDSPHLELYSHLEQQPGYAYGRYNSLLRNLSSFTRALDHRLGDPEFASLKFLRNS